MAFLVGGLSDEAGLPALRQLGRNVTRLTERNAELRVENARLRSRVRALERDPEALEWEARSKLHYVRDGEVIVPLPDVPPVRSIE